jgi:branched-chain amino acid transport system substrate-binding protein
MKQVFKAAALFTLLLLVVAYSAARAADNTKSEPILVGQIVEEKAWPELGLKHHRGVELAVNEINAAGGIHGRPIKLITRDGGAATPADVSRNAEDLVNRDGVRFLIGTIADNNSLAVETFAKQNKVFFIKGVNGSMRMIWQEGSPYFAHYGEPNYLFGGALAEAAAKTGAKKWAFVGPDYEFGHSVIEEFKKALIKKVPDAVMMKEYYFPIGKIDAPSVTQALQWEKPDGIFIALWGSDQVAFIREGKRRNLFDGKTMVSAILGQPENFDVMKAEVPTGWITQGWPLDEITVPEHKAFVTAYRKAYGEDPGYFSYVGYNAMKALAAAMDKASAITPEAVSAAMYGMNFASTAGPVTFRPSDGQSTVGLWVGKTAIVDGKPKLVDWTYEAGDKYYPGDDYVKTVRPQK